MQIDIQLLDNMGKYPCAMLVEGDAGIERIIDEAKKLCKEEDVLVALKDGKGVEKRLLPAYINAYVRYSERAMHSNSLSMEVLLFVAGNMNIANALKKAGAEGRRFILFSSSKELAGKLIAKCKLKKAKQIKLFLDQDIAGDIAMTAIRDDK